MSRTSRARYMGSYSSACLIGCSAIGSWHRAGRCIDVTLSSLKASMTLTSSLRVRRGCNHSGSLLIVPSRSSPRSADNFCEVCDHFTKPFPFPKMVGVIKWKHAHVTSCAWLRRMHSPRLASS